MNLYKQLTLCGFILIMGCNNHSVQPINQDKWIKSGTWRLALSLNRQELPLTLFIKQTENEINAVMINGADTVKTNTINYTQDSLVLEILPYGSILTAHIDSPELISGTWNNPHKNNSSIIPFVAEHDKAFRFTPAKSQITVAPTYQVVFSPNTESQYPAILKLTNIQGHITGTFLTESGDFRFLEGNLYDQSMHLSSFDGNLAYLFTASIQGDSLVDGLFYSGLRTPSNWIGFASEINNLRAPEQITKINAEKAPFDFYLPNQDGDTVSWKNLNLDGKVVIIDFTGSWCPNCIDATAALSLIESELNNDDLVILPIAFELTDNQNIGISRTKRMLQHKLDSKFIYGGQLNKTRLKKLFPMLEDFGAFPTLLFIDKQRQVRRIYTGFYGPGTGEYYQKFLTDSRGLIHTLLQE